MLPLRPALTSATYTYSSAIPHSAHCKHAGSHPLTTALKSIVREQVATFSRPFRSPTSGRAVTSIKHPHNHSTYNDSLACDRPNKPPEPPRCRDLPHHHTHRAPRDHRPACEDPHLGTTQVVPPDSHLLLRRRICDTDTANSRWLTDHGLPRPRLLWHEYASEPFRPAPCTPQVR